MKSFFVSGYHPITRWLHAGLLLGVVFQLFCATMMTHPDDGEYGVDTMNPAVVVAKTDHPMHHEDGLGEALMAAHRSGGFVVAFIVLANLLWAMNARGDPRKRQIAVLFSSQCWRQAISIAKGIPWILLGKRDLPEPGNVLALVFEMLGLMIMTVMAVSGVVIWSLWAGPDHTVSPQAQWVMAIHASIAVLLYSYLTGHITMALLHARTGDPVFARILPWAIKSKDNGV